MTIEQEPPLSCEEQLQAASVRIDELEQALRKEINFRTARDMQGKEVWLYVIDALNLRMSIRKEAEPSIEKSRAYDKLIFTVAEDGRVTDVKAAEENKS
jgi:hypothetical protein